jgi:copper chaperone CopZ
MNNTVTLKLSGLHCTSCATNIDLTLEDLEGVNSADTSYAKSETKISFDPSKTSLDQIKKTIESLGYFVTLP